MKYVRVLSEDEVLQKLDIPDFRHVTKNKLMSFAAMSQRMDPATVQKAMEQIPHLTQSLVAILGDYSNLIKQEIASNDEQTREYFSIAKSTIEALKNELNKPDISAEERRAVMDRMMVINEQISNKISEGHQFVHNEQITFGVVVLICVGFLGAILGGNTGFHTRKP